MYGNIVLADIYVLHDIYNYYLCFDLNLSLRRNHAKCGEIGSFILDAAENYGMENYLFIATSNLSMLLLFL